MRKSKFTPEQILQALRRAEGGTAVVDICRKLGVTETTFYRWKKQYRGVDVSELRELKQLREENRRLKTAVADLTLDKTILRDAFGKVSMTPMADSAGSPSVSGIVLGDSYVEPTAFRRPMSTTE
jgi:putative transposase